MAKAFFLAIGLSLCLLGGECFVIEKAVLAAKSKPKPASSNALITTSSPAPAQRVIQTPEWAPWTFLSAGAVIVLYSITLSRTD